MFTSTQPTRRQSGTAVYGIATEGLSVIFSTITRKGLLKSRLFGALQGDLVVHPGDGNVEKKRRAGSRCWSSV